MDLFKNESVNILSKSDKSVAPIPSRDTGVSKRKKFDWSTGGDIGRFERRVVKSRRRYVYRCDYELCVGKRKRHTKGNAVFVKVAT